MSDDKIIATTYPTDGIAQDHPIENYASSVTSSELSTTSTEMFEHEPFSTLQARAIELCKTIWPSLTIKAFQVIRMEGGSFNRVAKIRVDTSKKHSNWIQRQLQCLLGRISFKTQHPDIKEYLIRIPRYQQAWVEHEISILKYLRDTKVPTPEVIFFNLSSDNSIGNPFSIQHFLPGKPVQEEGFFNDDMFYLTHMDFEPRNLLLDITSPTTATLSAIIDWDEAVFAPAFANCRPPSWLWDFEGDGDLDEEVAHQTPDDPDLQAIKGAFEEAYRIARNICKLAITGFHSNDEYEVALGVIKQWNELKPHCRVGGLFEGEDNEDDE
ncbi:hypothetical protein BKA66DRAFT_428206 [Pyrenochaeta sp. MPI-SDFR-AT-0127]|nr:hypothetical protein BKA66DRAFT_428206 [Pyrenochaeta sp. MPI-SDFR-AT-0127]